MIMMKTVIDTIGICVDCGSTNVFKNKKGIICNDCGTFRNFFVKLDLKW